MVEEPRMASPRFITATWWLYVIIVAGVYNGNLIAFLTRPAMDVPIKSIRDLVERPDVMVSTLEGSYLHDSLRKAQDRDFKALWARMEGDPNALVDTYLEGLQRVLGDRKRAYLGDQSMYDALPVLKDSRSLGVDQCRFARPNKHFQVNYFAFPFQKGSPYTGRFSKQYVHDRSLN